MHSRSLRQYRELIKCMPVAEQTTISTVSTFQRYHSARLSAVLKRFSACNDDAFVEISRSDLFELADEEVSEELVYAVFVWGFPNGGRGGNFSRVVRNVREITSVFAETPKTIRSGDLNQLSARLQGTGAGLTLWTKLLYFLRFTVDGYPALILDTKVIRAFSRLLFEEGQELADITYEHGATRYPDYLRTMSRVSKGLGVDADKLEMFLFLFGDSLKTSC